MDIQLVTDMYGCAQYISGYITKGHGGLTKALEEAVNAVGLEQVDQWRHIGNKFLKASQFSVSLLLHRSIVHLPLRRNILRQRKNKPLRQRANLQLQRLSLRRSSLLRYPQLHEITHLDISVTTSFTVNDRSDLFTSTRGNLTFVEVVSAGEKTAIVMGSKDQATKFFPKLLENNSYEVTALVPDFHNGLLTLFLSDNSEVSSVLPEIEFTQPVVLSNKLIANSACYVEGMVRRVFRNTYQICANTGTPDSKCSSASLKNGAACQTCNKKKTKTIENISLEMSDNAGKFKVAVAWLRVV